MQRSGRTRQVMHASRALLRGACRRARLTGDNPVTRSECCSWRRAGRCPWPPAAGSCCPQRWSCVHQRARALPPDLVWHQRGGSGCVWMHVLLVKPPCQWWRGGSFPGVALPTPLSMGRDCPGAQVRRVSKGTHCGRGFHAEPRATFLVECLTLLNDLIDRVTSQLVTASDAVLLA